ncbi:hypothetical protein [Carboxylicivirga linearis]|uniref:Metallo-beta-lactamase domain-containing protein n=1 Tax=Carboxylicivirga linearis TaxID=1628157 RepID=A0ABS5K2V5_9BACT|nr:hypothetical protein [Carboxylicivirga linearis]MBS2100981.1 hypothetical protein [Carboxylicivirga linearis]
MKKFVLAVAFIGIVVCVQAQEKFQVKDLGKFKLHSFVTGDPLGDINYIIEGKNGVVIIEPVAFYDDIKVMKDYIAQLGKPVVKVIADYHIAGFTGYDESLFVRVEGMPEFSEGTVYGGMMNHFGDVFKDKMDVTKYSETEVIAKDAKKKWAGVEFQFAPGVASDFPASSIIIGKKVYYTHFTPAKAHPSPLQIHNRDAVNAVLSELEKVKASGCSVLIGGHGMATTDIETVEFEIEYLKKINKILSTEKTKDGFVTAVKKAYPNLEGDIAGLATALYK